MKVIFLDIDGVLNTASTAGKVSKTVELPLEDGFFMRLALTSLDEEAIRNLNRVTDATGAKIVISSSWRYNFREANQFPFLVEYCKESGITGEVIGRTKVYSEYKTQIIQDAILVGVFSRGKEIQMWLDEHPGVESFVIVDDMTDMDHLTSKLVSTNFNAGITSEDAERMIEVLGR